MGVAGITRGARMIGQRVRAGAVMHGALDTGGTRMIGCGVRAGVATVVEHHKRGGLARTERHVRNGLFSAAVGVQDCQNVSRGAPDIRILAKIGWCEFSAPESRRIGENMKKSRRKWDLSFSAAARREWGAGVSRR